MKLKITLLGLFFIISNMVFSQPWMEYVDADKKKQDKVTFFEIQEAFHKYEKEHNIENGYVIKDGEKDFDKFSKVFGKERAKEICGIKEAS